MSNENSGVSCGSIASGAISIIAVFLMLLRNCPTGCFTNTNKVTEGLQKTEKFFDSSKDFGHLNHLPEPDALDESLAKSLTKASFSSEDLSKIQTHIDQCPTAELSRIKSETQKFAENLHSLKEVFGETHEFTIEYKKEYLVSGDFNKAGQHLLPKELKGSENGEEEMQLFGLINGMKLSANEARVLSDLTGRKIPPTPNLYKDFLLLEPNEQGLIAKTLTKKKAVSYENLAKEFKIKKNTIVVFRGNETDIDIRLIDLCSSKNITFIQTLRHIIIQSKIKPEKIKFIYVASTETEKLKSLFNVSESQARDMVPIIEKIKKDGLLAETQSELSSIIWEEINTNKAQPVVIFNNINGKLFSKEPNEYQREGAIYLTCKSYKISQDLPQSSLISTDFVYFEDMIDAIHSSKRHSRKSANEFWIYFIQNYNAKQARRGSIKKVAVGVLAAGAAGIGVISSMTIYQSTKSKKKK